jgi:hypothetical protein
MATSGTIGQTTFDVAQAIEHAVRRCGKVSSTLTQEQLEIARDNLWLILTSMINRGMNLWTIEKILLTLNTNQIAYQLPVGTIDVLNTFYRNIETVDATWTDNVFNIVGELTEESTIVSFRATFDATITAGLTVSISDDNVTYTPVLVVASASYTSGESYWFDIEPTATGTYIKIANTDGISDVALTEALLVTQNNEITVNRVNRDDYTNLPNKFSSGTPSQFWFDRQIHPRIWLWPQPATADASIVIWRQREVQDVGAFTNTLEIPSRWYEPIIWQLAARLVFELPEIQPDRIQMVLAQAEKFDMEAGSEEYDNSPVYLSPNISGYT